MSVFASSTFALTYAPGCRSSSGCGSSVAPEVVADNPDVISAVAKGCGVARPPKGGAFTVLAISAACLLVARRGRLLGARPPTHPTDETSA